MGGNNMESLLMGGDDSSDDSDTENVGATTAPTTSVVAATIQPTASPTPPQQAQQPPAAAPAPAPPPAAAAQSQAPPKSQSELSQRLKSLYSPASHAKKQVPAAPATTAPQPPIQPQQAPAPTRPPTHSASTSSRSPHHHPGAPQQASVQRNSSQAGRPPQSVPPRSSSLGRQPSQGAPSYSSPPGAPPQQQQRYPSSSSQPPQSYQQPPSSYRTTSSSQHRSSSSASGRPPSQPPSSQQPPSMQRSSTSGSTPGGVPNPVPHGSVPTPGQRRGNVSSHDAFEPTPLYKIKEREQKAAQAAAAAANRGSSSYPSSSGASSSSGVPSGSGTSEREKEMRRQKERFLMFTRVLMKYLETKDPALHQKVKAIIKDCAERNKRQERGYESVTASMRERLKHVVGDAYWKRAESYLAHFLAQKQKTQAGKSGVDPQRQAAEMKRKQQQEQEARRRAELARQQKIAEQRKLQQQQQAQQQQAQQQQQLAAAQQTSATVPPNQGAAPPQTAKVARANSGAAGKGKRPATGKQAGGKTAKKARTKAATTAGRGSKTATVAGVAQSPTMQQQQMSTSQQALQPLVVPGSPMAAAEMRPPSPPPVRAYTELMELVDHAVHFDWTTAGLIMGSAVQKQQLQEEQRNLLYSNTKPASTPQDPSAASQQQKTPGGVPFALRGWGKRNLVSPRVAWARVRRREQPTAEAQRRYQQKYPEAPPIPTPATAWVHEEKAEDDAALCLLSEATQIYVTQILQKALACARQRQNLDGIRLWHQQCTAAVEAAKAEKEGRDKPSPPPLSIRLGCDVSRQVARTMGNAALTSKRMEEALERQKPEDLTRVVPPEKATTLNDETLASAHSMGELSLLPPLAKASENADYEAKRLFEVYGGKDSREPPFGRVPKKATLEKIDFEQGVQLNNFLGGRNSRRHRARTNAFSFPAHA